MKKIILIKFRKNLMFKRLFFLIMLFITFYIIFNFSSQDGEVSGSISRQVTECIVNILSKIKNISIDKKLSYVEQLHPIIRKTAHFSIYAVVGFSIMGFLCTFNLGNKFKIITSLVIGLIYAISDETHQYFIPGRSASLVDVAIDSAGIITGIMLLITLIVFVEKIRKKGE